MAVKTAIFTGIMVLLMCGCSIKALDRCLKTHRDKPCIATHVLPVTLQCRYPGQWFIVNKTEAQSNTGAWIEVHETKSAASQCKETKVSFIPGDYECDVSVLGPLGFGWNVRITYYCWEFDPDSLGGFGRKRGKFHGFPWSDYLPEDF